MSARVALTQRPYVGGTVANIHYHIKDLAADHRDELPLGCGLFLIVQTSEDPAYGMRIVVLDKGVRYPLCDKIRLFVYLDEETSSIAESFCLDEKNIRNLQASECERHRRSTPCRFDDDIRVEKDCSGQLDATLITHDKLLGSRSGCTSDDDHFPSKQALFHSDLGIQDPHTL